MKPLLCYIRHDWTDWTPKELVAFLEMAPGKIRYCQRCPEIQAKYLKANEYS